MGRKIILDLLVRGRVLTPRILRESTKEDEAFNVCLSIMTGLFNDQDFRTGRLCCKDPRQSKSTKVVSKSLGLKSEVLESGSVKECEFIYITSSTLLSYNQSQA
jgi:hypothetical protein